jgi:HAD superfamily hydrolase (TIGR01484 family)
MSDASFGKRSGPLSQPIGCRPLFPLDEPLVKLISTDFDGTLHADHESPPVPHDLQEMIAGLQLRGAKWVINTGRDLSSLMEALARAQLRIKPDFVVVVEREIYRHHESQYSELRPWNDRCRKLQEEVFARVRRDVPRLTAWVNERAAASVFADAWSPFCIIADHNEEMDAIQEMMEDYARGLPDLAVVRNDVYARFSHAAFNKGTALAEIARLLGVTAEETLAAGDHFNDLPMLSTEFAKLLICPHNSVEEVKAAVLAQNGYVSHQPWGHGVARGLEHYLGDGD